eukprot:m.1014531 g.1014531  ORF g.1014531 m.1014531 type:complete len:133 (-) comp24073_c1_seq1:2464-2862(-)
MVSQDPNGGNFPYTNVALDVLCGVPPAVETPTAPTAMPLAEHTTVKMSKNRTTGNGAAGAGVVPPTTRPFASYDEVLRWTAGLDPFNRASIERRPRPPPVTGGTHNRHRKLMVHGLHLRPTDRRYCARQSCL